MRRLLKKYLDPVVPLYFIVPGTLELIINSIIYYGGQLIPLSERHWDMTTALDRLIPVQAAWSVIYLFFFPFALYHFLLIAHHSRKQFYQLSIADIGSRLVCAVCFFCFPTTNIRPGLRGQFMGWMLGLVYASDRPVNLFPSIHCLVSWFCFIGVRHLPDVPRWQKVLTCLGAVLICLSTLFTRQHVIADVVSGIALAEGMYILAGHSEWPRRWAAWSGRISEKIFGKENVAE